MAATDSHHQAPRCLLRLYDLAAAGLADWSEFDGEAERWGRRGGLRTRDRYGLPYFSLLARFRWGRVEAEALIEHRAEAAR